MNEKQPDRDEASAELRHLFRVAFYDELDGRLREIEGEIRNLAAAQETTAQRLRREIGVQAEASAQTVQETIEASLEKLESSLSSATATVQSSVALSADAARAAIQAVASGVAELRDAVADVHAALREAEAVALARTSSLQTTCDTLVARLDRLDAALSTGFSRVDHELLASIEEQRVHTETLAAVREQVETRLTEALTRVEAQAAAERRQAEDRVTALQDRLAVRDAQFDIVVARALRLGVGVAIMVAMAVLGVGLLMWRAFGG